MRTSSHRPVAVLAGLLGLLAALLLPASTALAKEGVSVELAAPISRDAKPGEVVAVYFRLEAISDAGSTPLRGSDVFMRLYGPAGDQTQATGAEQRDAGLYLARIAIPAGGAARAEFGIHGSATDASGKTVASDVLWPYDGILVAAAIPASVAPRIDPAAGAPAAVVATPAAEPAATPATPAAAPPISLDLRLVLGAIGLAGLVAATALAVGRRRRGPHQTAA